MITALRCVHRDLRWADTAQVYDMGVLTERGDSLCRGCLPPPPPPEQQLAGDTGAEQC